MNHSKSKFKFEQINNAVGRSSHDISFYVQDINCINCNTSTSCSPSTCCPSTICPSTTLCETTCVEQKYCEKIGVGQFVCLPCNKIGFKVIYITKQSDACCVEKVSCEDIYKIKCDEIPQCINFKDLYYVEYLFPENNHNCNIEIIIKHMEKLEIFRYEGKIRKYTSCCGSIFFIELADTHEIRILNPDKLMPKRESQPTNEGSSQCDCCFTPSDYVDRQRSNCAGICPERTTHCNNFTNYNKIIIQGFSLDRLISCECEKRYLHIYDFCYYGRRC